jgi:hypothetical protein
MVQSCSPEHEGQKESPELSPRYPGADWLRVIFWLTVLTVIGQKWPQLAEEAFIGWKVQSMPRAWGKASVGALRREGSRSRKGSWAAAVEGPVASRRKLGGVNGKHPLVGSINLEPCLGLQARWEDLLVRAQKLRAQAGLRSQGWQEGCTLDVWMVITKCLLMTEDEYYVWGTDYFLCSRLPFVKM